MKRLLIAVLLIGGCAAPAEPGPTAEPFFRSILRAPSPDLKGSGIVWGLNGNGDSPGGEVQRALQDILGDQFGAVVGDINSRNVALVRVTTVMPEGTRVGDRLDVEVAAIGDASSLEGGVLFLTPLRGEIPWIFVLAQGRVRTDKEDPTAGQISGGARVEQRRRDIAK